VETLEKPLPRLRHPATAIGHFYFGLTSRPGSLDKTGGCGDTETSPQTTVLRATQPDNTHAAFRRTRGLFISEEFDAPVLCLLPNLIKLEIVSPGKELKT